MRATRIRPEVVLWFAAALAGLALGGPWETGIVYADRLPLPDGNMGIGTAWRRCALDVHGAVQTGTCLAGDVVFQREGKGRWRLFGDEDGLDIEKMNAHRVYSLIPRETDEAAGTICRRRSKGCKQRMTRCGNICGSGAVGQQPEHHPHAHAMTSVIEG